MVARIAAFLSVLWLLLALPVGAQEYQDLPPELEAQAQALNKQIMCPVCNGQTIGQSHSPIAQSMRETVRERLAAGQSNDEIMAYFVSSFGETVLAEPPKRGLSLVVWIVPPLALLAGIVTLVFVVRSLRRAGGQSPSDLEETDDSDPAEPGDPNLAEYLRVVDEEMADPPPNPRMRERPSSS